MVIYCVATGGSIALDPAGQRVSSASVGQMFMAGVIPGLMLATLLRRDDVLPRLEERLSAAAEGELGRALRRVPQMHVGLCC